MATITSLNYYQFAFNGFTFGGTNSPYQIQSVDGLSALPALRVQDSPRGYLDGFFSGRDFLSNRNIVITMLILSGNGQTAQANLLALQNALQPQQSGTGLLQFQLSPATGLQFINARVRDSKISINPNFTYGYIIAQYTFFAPNPAYYDNTTQTASLSPTLTGGRTYNRTYNLTYPAGSLTNYATITNSGNSTTYPTITINGPVTNPVIGNQTTNNALNFNYTMAQSDVISIDLYNRIITLNGNPARNLLLGSSTWFNAAPGTSLFYFNGTGYTLGVTSASVSWNNAYI